MLWCWNTFQQTTFWNIFFFFFFFFFFLENKLWYFVQIVSLGDKLHVMSKPISVKIRKIYNKLSSAEFVKTVVMVKVNMVVLRFVDNSETQETIYEWKPHVLIYMCYRVRLKGHRTRLYFYLKVFDHVWLCDSSDGYMIQINFTHF